MSGKSIPEIKRILQSPIPRFQLASLHISTFQLFNFSTPQPTPIHLSTYFFNTDILNLHKYEHLPFFCKMEVKMERAAKFPIKFRLGDVPYVDYLEGKRDTKY